jgi:hypothetical protein
MLLALWKPRISSPFTNEKNGNVRLMHLKTRAPGWFLLELGLERVLTRWKLIGSWERTSGSQPVKGQSGEESEIRYRQDILEIQGTSEVKGIQSVVSKWLGS